MKNDILLLGLGSDLRGDDAVGLELVRIIKEECSIADNIDVEYMCASGICLLTYLASYKRVIIVDSVQVKDSDEGKIWKLAPEDLVSSKMPVRMTHGMGIHSVIDICRQIGLDKPEEIELFLVGIKAEKNPMIPSINDSISAKIKEVMPELKEMIVKTLN